MPLYSNWLLNVLNGSSLVDWDTDVIRVSLFATAASAVVTNSTGQVTWSNISASEITGTGYTSSGNILASASIAFNGHAPTKIKLTASNSSWSTATLTAQYAVIWKQTNNPNTSPLIAWVDFGSPQSSSSGTFQINWNASGIAEIQSPN